LDSHIGYHFYSSGCDHGISELLISSLSTSSELTVVDNQTINDVIQNVESVQTAPLVQEMGSGRLSLVAGTGEISNFDLLRDLLEIVDFLRDGKAQEHELNKPR